MIIITRMKDEDLNTKPWGFMEMSPTNYGYSVLNRTVNLNLCMDVHGLNHLLLATLQMDCH